MIDLQKTSGLPIEATDDNKLKFDPPMQEFPMSFGRTFGEMIPLLLDPNIPAPIEITYPVYRGLYLPQHKDLVRVNHLSYDITMPPAVMLGKEFNKTAGHYHANKAGLKISHPEIYEVLHGQGIFLLQKMDEDFKEVLDVILVEAKTGDKIIYPPNYGHIFVNTGPDVLITANWCSTDYKALYEPVARYHGMSYYVVEDREKGYALVKNTNYKNHVSVRKINDQKMVHDLFGFSPDEPMYTQTMNNPNLADFLNNPENYQTMFEKLIVLK